MKKAKANKHKNSKLALFVFFDTKLFLCSTTPMNRVSINQLSISFSSRLRGYFNDLYIFYQKKIKKGKKAHLGMHYVSSKSTKKVCMRCASLNKLCSRWSKCLNLETLSYKRILTTVLNYCLPLHTCEVQYVKRKLLGLSLSL